MGEHRKATKASTFVAQSGFDQRSRTNKIILQGLFSGFDLLHLWVLINSPWKKVASVFGAGAPGVSVGPATGKKLWMWSWKHQDKREPVQIPWNPGRWTRTHIGLFLLSSDFHNGGPPEKLTALHHGHASGQESEEGRRRSREGWTGLSAALTTCWLASR